jgi:hypothetical protein
LPVSRFDSVLVERFAGFIASRLLDGVLRLRAAMGKPVGRRQLLGLTALGALARGAEIDKIAHAKLGVGWINGSAIRPYSVWNKLRRWGGIGSQRPPNGVTISSTTGR